MKLVISFILLSFSAYSLTNEEDIADQLENREWNYYSYLSGKNARIQNYFDIGIIENLQNVIEKFLGDLDSTSADSLQLFYPDLQVTSEDDRIVLKNQLLTDDSVLTALTGWTSLKTVVETERWEDLDPELCNVEDPVNDINCGRQTRGDYVLSHLTVDQLQQLGALSNILIQDLDYIKSNGELKVTPEIVRVFQFLNDHRAISSFFTPSYLSNPKAMEDDTYKLNRVEAIRAFIIQLFQDSNGNLENSNLVAIKLEDTTCFALDPSEQLDCQYSYIKDLLFTEATFPSTEAKNLIFDPKGISGLMSGYVKKYETLNDRNVSEDRLIYDFTDVFAALASIYDLDMASPVVSSETKSSLVTYLKRVNEYLLNNRSIVSLQIAKGIQKLILVAEEVL